MLIPTLCGRYVSAQKGNEEINIYLQVQTTSVSSFL